MIKAILFDLDGTLTLMDQEEFMNNYVGLLAPRFKQLISPDKFAKQIGRSIDIMIKEPKEGKSNLQVFFDDFTKATGLSFNILWPIFEAFYIEDFPALRCLVKTNPLGNQVVDSAIKQGYTVAIASNPVMPRIAMDERIRWAGLTPEVFAVVPSLESFHYCKPQLGFYEELAQRLGLPPSECLMVGNHPVEDLIAHKTGMKTFLVGTPSVEIQTDYAGDLTELNKLILSGNL